LKWHLQSPLLLLHSTVIDLQEANDSIDEEEPRLTSSTWSYIILASMLLENESSCLKMEVRAFEVLSF